jgi:hypothetical protein
MAGRMCQKSAPTRQYVHLGWSRGRIISFLVVYDTHAALGGVIGAASEFWADVQPERYDRVGWAPPRRSHPLHADQRDYGDTETRTVRLWARPYGLKWRCGHPLTSRFQMDLTVQTAGVIVDLLVHRP